jgi:hypothetical protein
VGSSRDRRVDLLGAIQVLHKHLTDALCREVWAEERTTERRRIWTLERLVEFWVAVMLDPPRSLRQALAEAAPREARARYPAPSASHQALYAHLQGMNPRFFRAIFEAFNARATARLKPCFAKDLHPLYKRFGQIVIADGSRLDPVARRLKPLRGDADIPLAGSIWALYDPCRGTLAHLGFDPNPAASEVEQARPAVAALPRGSLVLADRLYGVPALSAHMTELELCLLARRFSPVTIRKIRTLHQGAHQGGIFEDLEVWAGTKNTRAVGPQRMRLIRWKAKPKSRAWKIELLTNVLKPDTLGAAEALLAYRYRWKVERLFSDLKEVFNLRRFYTANTNAVAVQVYSAAIVHTAFRVAQGQIAKEVKLEPECLSPQKLFPRLAATSQALVASELMFEQTVRLNPRVTLLKPPYDPMPWASTPLSTVLVDPRKNKPRSPRRFGKQPQWRCLPTPRPRPRHPP